MEDNKKSEENGLSMIQHLVSSLKSFLERLSMTQVYRKSFKWQGPIADADEDEFCQGKLEGVCRSGTVNLCLENLNNDLM